MVGLVPVAAGVSSGGPTGTEGKVRPGVTGTQDHGRGVCLPVENTTPPNPWVPYCEPGEDPAPGPDELLPDALPADANVTPKPCECEDVFTAKQIDPGINHTDVNRAGIYSVQCRIEVADFQTTRTLLNTERNCPIGEKEGDAVELVPKDTHQVPQTLDPRPGSDLVTVAAGTCELVVKERDPTGSASFRQPFPCAELDPA